MPGANCSIFGCSSSRYTPDISIFRVPRGDNEYNVNWRSKLINIVTKDRVVDKSLREQIKKKNISICERHFEGNQLRRSKYFN